MGYIIVNGRRLDYNGSGISGQEIINNMNPEAGRRPVIRAQNMEFAQIQPNKFYPERELVDKRGQPVKVTSIPDRTKGIDYGQPRDVRSKSIIRDQVYDIAANCFKNGVEFDETNADWLIVPRYRLPRIWQVQQAPLMVLFPTLYPDIPPIGFYLPSTLSSPNGHFFQQAYHDASSAPTRKDWKWYCCVINAGAWRPAYLRNLNDWRQGDNLWTYITLVNEVLASHGA